MGTNLLTKFHEDRKINVASRVLTRKNASPPGSHFHEDWTVNVASRVPLEAMFFQANIIIFKLIQDIIQTNLLTKFHEDWTINVASRVLTRKNARPPDIIGTNLLTKFYDDRKINVASRVKNAPPPWWPCFSTNSIIFELVPDIIGMNLLTKFHEDQTINVASRVKNDPPLGSHVFQSNVTIFELIQNINKRVNKANVDAAQFTTHDAHRTKGDHKSSP
ncbi:hypothetical protein DPMN_007459 [Dreissena polymorpha]|uniref:Uncharacterized protein n=1 Tax=Dreissena polymorpha TaxID=45954 RepID=A0A9D4RYR2_DREPO|nr:hypothetical protein DPMN_007459 [Dreissena polymorpha]